MKKVITVIDNNSIVTVHRPKDLTAYELEIIITVLKKDLEDKRSEYETKESGEDMTNYKWIVENMDELVKDILTDAIGKEEGEPKCCRSMICLDCDFRQSLNDNQLCEKSTREWLEAEYESYKKGDVVIDKDGVIWVVARVEDEMVKVFSKTRYITEGLMADIPESDITKKVGNIYDK